MIFRSLLSTLDASDTLIFLTCKRSTLKSVLHSEAIWPGSGCL